MNVKRDSNKGKEQQPRNAKADKAARKNRKKGINPDAHKANRAQQVRGNRKSNTERPQRPAPRGKTEESKEPTPSPLPGPPPSSQGAAGKKKKGGAPAGPVLTQQQVAAATVVAKRKAGPAAIKLECKDCKSEGKEQCYFMHTGSAQTKFALHGWSAPTRCPECRGLAAIARKAKRVAAKQPDRADITVQPSAPLADIARGAEAEAVEAKTEKEESTPPARVAGINLDEKVKEPSDEDDSDDEADEGKPLLKNPEKESHYHFLRFRYPREESVNAHNPHSRARNAMSALDVIAIQAQDAFTDTKQSDGMVEFDEVPVPTDLVSEIKFLCGTQPKTSERKRALSLAVGRKVRDYERKVATDPSFWSCLRGQYPQYRDRPEYFMLVGQAMSWYALVTNPLIATTTEQAYRQTEGKRQAAVAFNHGELERWRHVRALGAACSRNQRTVLGSLLFCAAADPSTSWTVLKGAAHLAAAALSSATGLLCNTLAIAGLCCVCYDQSETCQHGMQRAGAHLAGLCDPVCQRATRVAEPAIRRFKRLRNGIFRGCCDEDQRPPPDDENPGGGDGKLGRPKRQEPAPELELVPYAHKRQRLMEADDEKVEGVLMLPDGDLKLPPPNPLTMGSSTPSTARNSFHSIGGLLGGEWLFGAATPPHSRRSSVSVSLSDLDKEEAEGDGPRKEAHFRRPAVAFPARPSGSDELGAPVRVRAEPDGKERLLYAYSGYDPNDIQYEFIDVQQVHMGVQDILDFHAAGGEYRHTYSTFVMNEPAPYRNPDMCPHMSGVECQMPEPPDAVSEGPKAFIDPTFRLSWKSKMKPRTEDRFDKVVGAAFENSAFAHVAQLDLPQKQWWITGPLLWQSPPAGYRASVNNFCFGMGRHYGTKPIDCSCDTNPAAPIADYTFVGTCDMCVVWEQARLAMLPWSSALPAAAGDYLDHLGKVAEPADVLFYAEAVANGEVIPYCSAADDRFGFVSWYGGLDSSRRRLYGPGVCDLLEGKFDSRTFSMTAFIKWEKATQNLPNGTSKRLKAPRLVCPSKLPHANLVSGPVFKAVSKALTWDAQKWLKGRTQAMPKLAPDEISAPDEKLMQSEVPPIVITSGMSPRNVGAVFGEWLKEECIVIEFDFKGLDSSENKQYARVVYPILANIIQDAVDVQSPEALKHLFKSMSHRWLYTPFGKFLYTWGLCSGFGGTYHINSIGVTIAVCGRLWVRLKEELTRANGIAPIGEIFDYIRYIGLGDDGLAAIRNVPRDIVAKVKQLVVEDLKTMGLHPTPVHSLIPSFCSALFWPIIVDGQETYVLGPEILRLLSRFGATFNHTKPTCTREQGLAYCKGNALSNMHWKGIPVLRVIWNYYSKVEGAVDVSQLEEHKTYESDPDVKYAKSAKTNHFMTTAYGLDPEEVHSLESELHSALVLSRGGPCFFASPILHNMAEHFERVRDQDVLPPPAAH